MFVVGEEVELLSNLHYSTVGLPVVLENNDSPQR
jgi:hypothetical protein